MLTRDEFRDQQQEQVDQFLTVLVAILALSEMIAILGIVNTLALSVFERTRELGLLRTVGMSRRQVRRMVRWESVVIAVIGAVVGLALGLVWGWVFTRALRSEGLTVFSVPVAELGVFLVLADARRGRRRGRARVARLPTRGAGRHRRRVTGQPHRAVPAGDPLLPSLAHQGRLAQSVEHFLDTEGVRRSSRLPPTTMKGRVRSVAMSRSVPLLLLMALALVGCYAKPVPMLDAAPEGCDPAKILFVGDSLLGQAEQPILDEFQSHGYQNEIEVIARGGVSVHEYSYLDAPEEWGNPREELQEPSRPSNPMSWWRNGG